MNNRKVLATILAAVMLVGMPVSSFATSPLSSRVGLTTSGYSGVVAAAVPKKATGLYKQNGTWKYFENGVFKKATGMVRKPADGHWYYVENGVFSNKTGLTKKVKSDGHWYYVERGHFEKKTGLIKRISDGAWFYVKRGVFDKTYTGLCKRVSDGAWFYVKRGAFNKLTGIVAHKGNNFYVYRGGLNFKVNDGVTYNGSDWLVMNSVATKAKTASDKTLFRALKIVAKITNSSMTKEQKLKVCFDYVKKTYREYNPRIPHYKGMDWPVVYANDMFVDGGGNCISYAAALAYMAKAIGYKNVYGCHSGGHGWAEIDGLIYDPEWSMHHFQYSYYALSYDSHTDQNYRGAIAAGYPWMRIKI